MKRGRSNGSPVVSACRNCGCSSVSFPSLFCQACTQHFMRLLEPTVTNVAAQGIREAESSRREALAFLAGLAPTEDGASPTVVAAAAPPPPPAAAAAETPDVLELGQMLLNLANVGGQGATRAGDHGREEEEVVDDVGDQKNDKKSTS